MKITAVYGTERKGCSYTVAEMVLSAFPEAELERIVLPHDCPPFCTSCFRCFTGAPEDCPHSAYTMPIRQKLCRADLIILVSPVYSFHMSGAMKSMLDHFANMWMVHRPEAAMFSKQGLVVATASGPVYGKTLAGMKDSLDFWGVARSYRIGAALFETDWSRIPDKRRLRIRRSVERVCARIRKRAAHPRPCLRVRFWFAASRLMHKYIRMNPPDVAYWEKMGWTGATRPWKARPSGRQQATGLSAGHGD